MPIPLLLKESHFQCKERQVWLSVHAIKKLEAVLSEPNTAIFYDISIKNFSIGSIFQCLDGSWTASPKGFKPVPLISQSVMGFAHELYAAKYLEQMSTFNS